MEMAYIGYAFIALLNWYITFFYLPALALNEATWERDKLTLERWKSIMAEE